MRSSSPHSGKLLYPGLQTGFLHIREAVSGLRQSDNERVLVVSTSPGLTAKWLAARLYRFAGAHPEIDTRISSSLNNANFATDGVDLAIRNMPDDPPPDPALDMEKLISLSLVPVCSPKLIESLGPLNTAELLAQAPLIHDDTLVPRARVPTWTDWFAAAGLDHVEIARGLSFNSADHALDAASEGAGVLLVTDILAYDLVHSGRLVIPVPLALPIRPRLLSGASQAGARASAGARVHRLAEAGICRARLDDLRSDRMTDKSRVIARSESDEAIQNGV